MTRICHICNNEFTQPEAGLRTGRPRKYCDACKSEALRIKDQRREGSPAREAWRAAYAKSAQSTTAQARYRQTTKYKQTQTNRDLLRQYNITTATRNWMLLDQGFMCAICRNEIDFGTLRVDHDHSTNKVRGLLCGSCNLKMAALDDTRFMAQAPQYKAYYDAA